MAQHNYTGILAICMYIVAGPIGTLVVNYIDAPHLCPNACNYPYNVPRDFVARDYNSDATIAGAVINDLILVVI